MINVDNFTMELHHEFYCLSVENLNDIASSVPDVDLCLFADGTSFSILISAEAFLR